MFYCLFCGEEFKPSSRTAEPPSTARDSAKGSGSAQTTGQGRQHRDTPEPDWSPPFRRDCEPHRAGLITTLGNISLIAGGLSLCLFGLGGVVSIPVGVVGWVLANRDLVQMRQGTMDPTGQLQTEAGRSGSIAGVFLGLVLGLLFALLYLTQL